MLAAAAEGPVELFLHRRDGVVEQVPTLLESDPGEGWLVEQARESGAGGEADPPPTGLHLGRV